MSQDVETLSYFFDCEVWPDDRRSYVNSGLHVCHEVQKIVMIYYEICISIYLNV